MDAKLILSNWVNRKNNSDSQLNKGNENESNW